MRLPCFPLPDPPYPALHFRYSIAFVTLNTLLTFLFCFLFIVCLPPLEHKLWEGRVLCFVHRYLQVPWTEPSTKEVLDEYVLNEWRCQRKFTPPFTIQRCSEAFVCAEYSYWYFFIRWPEFSCILQFLQEVKNLYALCNDITSSLRIFLRSAIPASTSTTTFKKEPTGFWLQETEKWILRGT